MAKTKWMTTLLWVLAHFAASVGAFLWHYSVNATRFDGKPVPGGSLRLSGLLHDVFWFPVADVAFDVIALPSFWGWAPLLLNSVLAVLLLQGLFVGVKSIFSRQTNLAKVDKRSDQSSNQ